MTPAAYVKSLLDESISTIPELDSGHIHSFFIPSDDNNNNSPIIVVSEIPSGTDEYGNDFPILEQKKVQLEIYYPKDYVGDMSNIESALKNILLNNSIYCFSDAGHVITPDSKNIINTLKFNYNKEVM
ncbi:DUF806 family protein [Liquorilactobacillus nagelii]|jgi:hypothetical protein|uniref:DUF806 family protein n=1 Tax=Liquorilactobacillus nagelii TaxID=82688 RepID=UPI00242AE88B|nr:DUF806 family protein [Liquorilactobacillus nagelii]MCI1699994.1 DUF806 family protein [Liquorilactobacillus nagelii]